VSINDRPAEGRRQSRDVVYRWECRCQDPPVLLATYEPNGRINIKVRDRYWHVFGSVRAICPKCGADHVLDLRGTTNHDAQPVAL
jgi:hypothetical protein